MSGMFGVGGATLIVPLLLMWVNMPQRLAAGTSAASILPTAIAGSISYTVAGHINWIAAALLAVGIIVGAQVGAWLLQKLKVSTLQLIFMVFLAAVVVSLWLVVPSRDAAIDITPWLAFFLVFTGFITGIMSGLLGVGGGIVAVPALLFFFGASDLEAKGTSLAMMIPGSISATLANLKRHNVDLKAAAIIGLASAAMVPFSVYFANLINPLTANILFSLYLVTVIWQMFGRWRKSRESEKS